MGSLVVRAEQAPSPEDDGQQGADRGPPEEEAVEGEDADAGRDGQAVARAPAVEQGLPQLHQHVALLELAGVRLDQAQLFERGGDVLVPEADVLAGAGPQGAGVAGSHGIGFHVGDGDLQILFGQLNGVGVGSPLQVVSAAQIEHDPAVRGAPSPDQKRDTGKDGKDSASSHDSTYRITGSL